LGAPQIVYAWWCKDFISMELRSQRDGDANYPAGKVFPEYTGR